jgi:proline dehydrogenase
MPIEVRELVIKAVVTQDSAGGASGDAPQANGNSQEEIIQACVEKIMDILKEKNER